VTRSTDIWWKSYVSSNSTQRSLTEELMHETFLEAKKKGDPKYILTHFDVYSAYGQLLSPDRRYTSEMKLKGGFTGWSFNEIPVIADYDCPYDEMYFVDPSSLSVEDLAPMSFLKEDGSILDRSSTQPIWQATLRYYANLATSACNKNAALRDVIK
ncbi:MAG: phage major capsid protein, partial [Nanoarchaeota archaeon]|nr:phage major capsid protein [Nanoarchaeota archaeon]